MIGLALAPPAMGVVRPSSQSDGFVESIGVNIHASNYLGYGNTGTTYDNWNGIIQVVGDLGFRYVRDHPIAVDRLNALTAATGAKICSISEMQDTTNGSVQLNLARFDEAMQLTRALTGLAMVEGPNELEGWGDPNWMPKLLQWQTQMYQYFKSDPALSEIPVLVPTVYGRPGMEVFQPWCDYGNMHSYPPNDVPTTYLDGWMAQQNLYLAGGKPIYGTETGYRTGINDYTSSNGPYAVSEAAQAKYIPRLYMDYFNRGIVKTFLYELADDIQDDAHTNAGFHFGLVRHDLSYKPSAVRMKNLIALLGDVGDEFTPGSLDYSITGGNAALREMLLQKRDGSYYLALWQDLKTFEGTTRTDIVNPALPITLQVNIPLSSSATWLLDSTTPASTHGAVSSLALNVPDEVMLVRLTPAAATTVAWVGGDGAWSDSAHWGGPAPQGAFAGARFAGAGSRVVTVDSPRTVGEIEIDSADAQTIAGAAVLTINTPAFGAIRVQQGSHAISAPLVLARDTTVTVAAGAQLALTALEPAPNAIMTKSGAGLLEVRQLAGKGLIVNSGRVRVLADAGQKAARVEAVKVKAGGKLDLSDQALVTRTPVGRWDGAAYTGVSGMLQSGRNGGSWDGDGIMTSSASGANEYTMLGAATGSEVLGLSAGQTAMWRGQSVGAGDTLVKYTYGGDANLSGFVDVDDYGQIDFNYATGGTLKGFFNGDFTYDGQLDVDDYGVIDFVVNIQGPAFPTSDAIGAGASVASVPEPGVMAPLVAAMSGFMARRRRFASICPRPALQ